MLGIPLSVEEVVNERTPPFRKVWETRGSPRLLVIGHYRMGFEISPMDDSSRLRVFLDYELPGAGFAKYIGRMLGDWYARWCTTRMADDAARHFSKPA